MKLLGPVLALCLLPVAVFGAQSYDLFARTNLVAWCIVPFDAKKRGSEERAAMLERLGIRQFAYDYRAEHIPTFDAEMEALKRHDVRLLAWWFPGALNGENSAPIRDVSFRDCDIIRDTCQWEPVAALACMLERSAPVERILFEDIRCEDIARNFIHLSIQSGTQFSGGEGPGYLRNVTFRRVSYLGSNQPLTRVSGHSLEHEIENITFDQIRFGGREARSESDLNLRRNEFVRGLRFIGRSHTEKPGRGP